MKLLMFAASVRTASVNKKLLHIAANMARQAGAEVDVAEFAEFNLPLYDANLQESQGIPAVAQQFVQRMDKADAIVIASPEYNFSVPGTLKNLIDWVSRLQPMPWQGRCMLLMSASPSLVGGNRGLWSLRQPLEACGAFVHPDMFSLASAYSAFNEQNELIDPQLQKRLQDNVTAFLQLKKS